MCQLAYRQRGNLDFTDPDNPSIESKNFGEQWTLDPTGNWEAFQQDTDGDEDWDLDQSRSHDKVNEIKDSGDTN